MPLHTHSAAPVASPKRGVLWCVYVYWIYKEKILHPLQNRLSALCYAGSFFRVVWLPLLWEAELINVWSRETQFFCPYNLFTGHVAHLHTPFLGLGIIIYMFTCISSIPLQSHTSFKTSTLTSRYHQCLLCLSKQLQFLIIVLPRRPVWCKKFCLSLQMLRDWNFLISTSLAEIAFISLNELISQKGGNSAILACPSTCQQPLASQGRCQVQPFVFETSLLLGNVSRRFKVGRRQLDDLCVQIS